MMTNSPKTSAEQHIEAVMRQLDPASPRYRVLVSARDFKSSWFTLGEQLQSVRRQQLFSDWGYPSFEDYCLKEIRIKKPTALKLTNAYHFLEKQEPDLLAREGDLQQLPDYRAIDLLRQAHEQPGFNEDAYQQLRQAVIGEGRSLPTVRQQYNSVARTGEAAEDATRRTRQSALSATRRLLTILESLPELGRDYSTGLHELVRQLVEDLTDETEEPTEQRPTVVSEAP